MEMRKATLATLKKYTKTTTQYEHGDKSKWYEDGMEDPNYKLNRWYRGIVGYWAEKYAQHQLLTLIDNPKWKEYLQFNVKYKTIYGNKVDRDIVIDNQITIDVKNNPYYYTKPKNPYDLYWVIKVSPKDKSRVVTYKGSPCIRDYEDIEYFTDYNNLVFYDMGFQYFSDVRMNGEFRDGLWYDLSKEFIIQTLNLKK